MKKIINYLKNVNILYLYVMVFLLIVSTIFSLILFCNKKTIVKKVIVASASKVEEKKNTIKIDIKGNVQNPGVYELEENSRVVDAINISGGLKENSNTELINLAQKLTDEMTIIIYTNQEIEKYRKDKKQKEIVRVEVEKCPDNINDACINKNNSKDSNNSGSNLVSINVASIEDFQKLPGVGESKAKAIIEYRNTNGNFNSIEDIKNVSGIGDSLFEKIKNNITI